MIYSTMDIMSFILNSTVDFIRGIYRLYAPRREKVLGALSALVLGFQSPTS